MHKSIGEVPAESGDICCVAQECRFNQRAIRELIIVTSPVLHPSWSCCTIGMVGNRHLGNQNGVVPIRSENHLIDFVLMPGYVLPQISHAKNSVERISRTGIVGTDHETVVGKEADASAVAVLFWTIIVQKFRTAFILPDLDITIIGSGGHETVVSYLVCVVGGGAPRLIHGRNGFGICDLVAGVLVGRHPKRVAYPFSKMARPVSVRCVCLRFKRATHWRARCSRRRQPGRKKTAAHSQSCQLEESASPHSSFPSGCLST